MESKGNRNDWCRPFHLRTEFNSLHAHTHFSWNSIQCRRYTKCKAQQYTMSEVTTTCARIEKAKWHKMKKKMPHITWIQYYNLMNKGWRAKKCWIVSFAISLNLSDSIQNNHINVCHSFQHNIPVDKKKQAIDTVIRMTYTLKFTRCYRQYYRTNTNANGHASLSWL